LNLKPLFKASLAAAAVIAIGLALLFNAPAAKAVTIEQICRAIENARNIYITTFKQAKRNLNKQYGYHVHQISI